MNVTNRQLRSLAVAAFLAVTVLSACVTPAAQWRAVAPSPCADTTYLQLKRQHPDSLSEREWQRFQSLDTACTEAQARARERAVIETEHGGWMGMGHGGISAGFMTAVMVAMMITMW